VRKGSDKKGCEHNDCSYRRKRNSLILKFLWDTGARLSEVAGVRIKDLDTLKN
jgi:integrase